MRTVFINTVSAMTVAATAFTFAFAATSGTVLAADKLDVQYDLYTRGMRVFALSYTADIDRKSFKSSATLRPKGLVSLFIDLKMDMKSSGTVSPGGVQSSVFSMNIKEKRRKGSYTVNFDGLIPVSSKRDPALKDKTEAKVNAAAAEGVRDTLASILNLSVDPEKDPCNAKYRVYNGKEVFQLAFRKIRDDVFGTDAEGVYRGPAIACSMTYSPLAGLSARAEARFRENPLIFNVWFAPVRSSVLGRDMNVLIAASGKIKDKDFVAYASRATLSGQPLNAKSLASR